MHHVFRLTYTDFFFSAKEAFSALHLPSKVTPMVSYYETLLHNGTHSLTHNLLSEATADVNSDSWSEFSRLHLSNTLTTSHTAPQYNFLPFTCPSSWQLISHSLCTNTPWLFFICNPQKQLPCGCFLASLKPSTVVMLCHTDSSGPIGCIPAWSFPPKDWISQGRWASACQNPNVLNVCRRSTTIHLTHLPWLIQSLGGKDHAGMQPIGPNYDSLPHQKDVKHWVWSISFRQVLIQFQL